MQCRLCNPVQCPTARAVVVNSSSREAVGDARRAARRRRRSCDSTGVDEVAANRVGAVRDVRSGVEAVGTMVARSPATSTKCAPTTSVTCMMRKVSRVACNLWRRGGSGLCFRPPCCLSWHPPTTRQAGPSRRLFPRRKLCVYWITIFTHSWLPVRRTIRTCRYHVSYFFYKTN